MRTFFEALNGSNCLFGGQTILSLHSTEDVDADYATASATCLAPNGAHLPGAVENSIEGGVDTGLWVVDVAEDVQSSRTWRQRPGIGYAHLPMVSYRLRRHGYLAARSTLSKMVVGKDHYPPKFATYARMNEIYRETYARLQKGEIDHWQLAKERGSWIWVADAADLIRRICAFVGLPVEFRCSLPACAAEYRVVSKSVISACKEVASWSGASCYLDRQGTLIVFDWSAAYTRGEARPAPPALTELRGSMGLPAINLCTVVGYGYVKGAMRYEHHWFPDEEYQRGYWEEIPEAGRRAIQESAQWADGTGYVVEDRIEINEYPINPAIALALARERVARAVLAAYTNTATGPAEGYQSVCPLEYKVFSVTRRLEWTGNAYRYEAEVTAPTLSISFGDYAAIDDGWW